MWGSGPLALVAAAVLIKPRFQDAQGQTDIDDGIVHDEGIDALASSRITISGSALPMNGKPAFDDRGRYHSLMVIRSFSSQFDDASAGRYVDDDAPAGLRQEYIDAVYLILERQPQGFNKTDERRLYNVVSQSLGIQPSGEPYSGFRYAISRDVNRADWQRFYDLISRVSAEVPQSFQTEYRQLVNQLLASYKIAWELRGDNQFHRVLPQALGVQVEAAFRELSQPRFAAALASFQQSMAAYNDRPQRGKDACKNMFDALEALAKELGQKPTGTFGDVLNDIRKTQFLSKETIGSLQKLYDLANSHFRHGTAAPFALKAGEVDYVMISCLGALLLFLRVA
jgi:hypothetical protein